MNNEIYNRAYEMIANGFEFGQIQRGDTWERLMQGGPYSDIYTCAEKLEEEFGVNINVGLKYLKNAFDEYESEIYESRTNKNVIKLNESQLKRVIAESVMKVLKEYYPDKVARDTQIEMFRKKQIEQDEKEISNCMSELKPIFNNLQDKYGYLVYTAIMRLAKEMNPYPEA